MGRWRTYSMEGQAGTTRRGWGGDGETGSRAAGEGVEPGRDTEVERVKGENGFLKSARDIILVPTSDVVIVIPSDLAQPDSTLRHSPPPTRPR